MIDSSSPSLTPFGGSDFLMEEIDEFHEHDDSIPPGVDSIYDSEGDTVYLEELLSLINSDPNLPPSPCWLRDGEFVRLPKTSFDANSCKDHFPLPFMDQMLERLAGNEYYCFLDGFSGYFQIPIDPLDKEKTTFTCPYGTFAYRRMPFGLCNASGTF
ncbi:hypothetical protein Tco_0519119 [Tanacetum coccineum]